MKILAVYGSNYGQAEKVLRRVVDTLARHGHEISVHKGDDLPEGTSVERYDAVLVGASIVVGKYQDYIREFVKANRDALDGRPTAFVSVNGANPETEPEWRAEAKAYVEALVEETGWRPRWTGTFSGALRYPRYGFVTRFIMKRISRSHGGPTDTSREYEFTDWDAVDRFAAELAEGLAASA